MNLLGRAWFLTTTVVVLSGCAGNGPTNPSTATSPTAGPRPTVSDVLPHNPTFGGYVTLEVVGENFESGMLAKIVSPDGTSSLQTPFPLEATRFKVGTAVPVPGRYTIQVQNWNHPNGEPSSNVFAFNVADVIDAPPGSPTKLSIEFADPIGDQCGPIDVTGLRVNFDRTTGSFTILVTADRAHPFKDVMRLSVNLFDPDRGRTNNDSSFTANLGPGGVNVPQATTTLELTGTSERLRTWVFGERVATSDPPFGSPAGVAGFRSGVTPLPLTGVPGMIAPAVVFPNPEDAIAYGESSRVTAQP